MNKESMFIGGEWVESASGEFFPDLDPATGEVFAEIPKGDARDADLALAAAYGARSEWASTRPQERAEVLSRASAELERNVKEFAGVLTREGGAVVGRAMFEARHAAELLHTAGEVCQGISEETHPADNNGHCLTFYRPLGAVVAISPWYFPLSQAIEKVSYALAAGNTVVLKPSGETPLTGLKIGRLFQKAGLPAGVLNVVTGPGCELEEALTQDDRTSLVTFAGETAAGRRVARMAAAKIKKYTLELGGKNPLVILGDADLEYALNAAAVGVFMHKGPISRSVERIIVERSIAEEFSRGLAAKVAKMTLGDPNRPETLIGPLINDEQVQKIHAQVNEAVSKGAKLITGGGYKGRFYKPTVLTDVTRDMKIFREENFGPVAPIIAVKDEKEAVRAANDSRYGPSAGVITNDMKKALYLAEHIGSKTVQINDAYIHEGSSRPLGRGGDNGFKSERGRRYREEMGEFRRVTIRPGKRRLAS